MLNLSLLPDLYAVVSLQSNSLHSCAELLSSNSFFSLTKTEEELSLVCLETQIPADAKAERGWRIFKVEGPLDFAQTGVLSSLALPLAEASVSIFTISTFDTDYILVKESQLCEAKEKLALVCHLFDGG